MTPINPQRPTSEELQQIDIHHLLPQQEPFVMVGRLTQFDERLTVTQTTIAADNLFVEHGHFSATGLMENIAQTCAARIGYVNQYILHKGIQIGLIGAIRGLEVLALPAVGTTITTRVEVAEEIFGMTLANATVTQGDQTLVTAQMKIAVKEQDENP